MSSVLFNGKGFGGVFMVYSPYGVCEKMEYHTWEALDVDELFVFLDGLRVPLVDRFCVFRKKVIE